MKIQEDGSVKLPSNLAVSALKVLSTEECREEMNSETIQETGFSIKEKEIANKFFKGFTSDFSCIGNDFSLEKGKETLLNDICV